MAFQRKELNFRRRFSGVVCKLPYAAVSGNSLVVNDKENGNLIPVGVYCRAE